MSRRSWRSSVARTSTREHSASTSRARSTRRSAVLRAASVTGAPLLRAMVARKPDISIEPTLLRHRATGRFPPFASDGASDRLAEFSGAEPAAEIGGALLRIGQHLVDRRRDCLRSLAARLRFLLFVQPFEQHGGGKDKRGRVG